MMRRLAVLLAVFAAGIATGWYAFTGPLDGERRVAEKLIEHRERDGFAPREAACHLRPDGDVESYACEVWEAIGRSDGYVEFIVRHHEDKWVFERLMSG
jgi:hypothetical protein